jgi:N-formylglutamate amidohydrolase
LITIETIDGKLFEFNLNKPFLGVYIPRLCWRTMQYTHNAVQICLASKEYDEADYIRDYEEFKKLQTSWAGN